MENNDDFLKDIDFSQFTEEDLENLGLDPNMLDEITLSGLTPEEIKDIQKEAIESIDNEEYSESEISQEEITKSEIIDGIKKLKNNLKSLTLDIPNLNKSEKQQNIYNFERIFKRRFKKHKRHITEKQKEIIRKYYLRLIKFIHSKNKRKRKIPGISVNNLYIKYIKPEYGLYIPYLSFQYRPNIYKYSIKENEIPIDAEIITENNEVIKPISEIVETKSIREEDIIIHRDEDDSGISLKELKQKTLNTFKYNMSLLCAKINDVNNYQKLIDRYNTHPSYGTRSRTHRNAINIDNFIYKHFKPFQLIEKKVYNLVKIHIKLKNKKEFIEDDVIKKRDIPLRKIDRHKKYEKIKGHCYRNVKEISKEELIQALNTYKNCSKTAEHFQVSYNTFKKYARLYGINTKQYWKEYLEKTKNKEILPNFGKPKIKPAEEIKQKIFIKFDIKKPEDVYSKTESFISNFYDKKDMFSKHTKQEDNNIKKFLYNGPFIYNFNIENNKLYKIKEFYVNKNIKENKCEICGRSETKDNPLLINFIDGKLDNLSIDNIQISCYHCFITKRLFKNVKEIY